MTSPHGAQLPKNANLDNLKKRAKQLLRDARTGDGEAAARFAGVAPTAAKSGAPTLSDAQLVLAREYGFASWPQLKTAIEDQARLAVLNAGPGDPTALPMLPVRDFVVFPEMHSPIFVGRPASLRAVEAVGDMGRLFLCVQRRATTEEPTADDLYAVGTIAEVGQKTTLNDGTVRIIVKGLEPARLTAIDTSRGHLSASVQALGVPEPAGGSARLEGARRLFLDVAERLQLPKPLCDELGKLSDSTRLVGLGCQYLGLSLPVQQMLLELPDHHTRLARVVEEIERMRAAITRPHLDDYVGRYEMAPGFLTEVTCNGAHLIASCPWDRTIVLPVGEDAFAPKVERTRRRDVDNLPLHLAMPTDQRSHPLIYRFHRNEAGEVAWLSRIERGVTDWPEGCKLVADTAPATPPELPAGELLRYTGTYELRPGYEETVEVDRPGLVLAGARLLPISDTEFFATSEPLRVTFKQNRTKDVLGMSVRGKRMNGQYWKVQ